MTSRSQKSAKFYPCDQCLQRKVRCDKSLPRMNLRLRPASPSSLVAPILSQSWALRLSRLSTSSDKVRVSLPVSTYLRALESFVRSRCDRCSNSNLNCTREIVRRRPGQKKGSGTVISKLMTDPEGILNETRENVDRRLEVFTPRATTSVLPDHTLLRPLKNEEYFTVPPRVPRRVSTPYGSPANSVTLSERPPAVISNLPHLLQDIDQFFRDLYPIWPIINQASFREWLEQPDQIDHSQACLILSICALSALHIPEPDSPPREPRKRRAQHFIRQCMQLRSNFEYIESATILTVQTSLLLSVAEVELQKVHSSWFLLREAIMLAQDLGYYEASTLQPKANCTEGLSIQRTLYILSLTERGLTLLRNKPFAIVMFNSPPDERFENEDPRILIGLQSLSKLFVLLDKQFMDAWLDGSPGVTVSETRDQILNAQHTLSSLRFDIINLTDIQKADIMITQQWLRLVFWQLSMRKGLLSSVSEDPSLSYQFPCVIAKCLCTALGEISMTAVFLHGMAIFERTFEITYSFIDSLCLSRSLYSGLKELRVLFRVLRESPNSHNTYTKILETKLIEQAGDDGHGIISQIHQTIGAQT